MIHNAYKKTNYYVPRKSLATPNTYPQTPQEKELMNRYESIIKQKKKLKRWKIPSTIKEMS